MEFNFLGRSSTPSVESPYDLIRQCDTASSKQSISRDEKQGEEDEKCKNVITSKLDLKLPSPRELKIKTSQEEEEDECKTPTSSEHKIPTPLECPPAPRKPKTLINLSAKRKFSPRAMVFDELDIIESLFPPNFLSGLSEKVKKVKQEASQ